MRSTPRFWAYLDLSLCLGFNAEHPSVLGIYWAYLDLSLCLGFNVEHPSVLGFYWAHLDPSLCLCFLNVESRL